MISITLCLSIILLAHCDVYGADVNSTYNIVPLDYATHSEEALEIAKENIDLLSKMPTDSVERKKLEKRLASKFDVCMHNDYIMTLDKVVKGTMQRVVRTDSDVTNIKGLMSFYVRAQDKKGYIQELCSRPSNDEAIFKDLVDHVLTEFEKRGVSHTLVHVGEHDSAGQQFFKKRAFVELSQTEEDKELAMIAFEYTHPHNEQRGDPTPTLSSALNSPRLSVDRDTQEPEKVQVVPFDYAQHGTDVLRIGQENVDLVCALPTDPVERQQTVERLAKKWDAYLHNGYVMSLSKIKKDSLMRAVITYGAQVKGLIDFYIRAEDNKGYIETLYTSPRNFFAYQKQLLTFALSALKGMDTKSVLSHVFTEDTDGQTPFNELNFVRLPQGEIEKRSNAFAFEYTY